MSCCRSGNRGPLSATSSFHRRPFLARHSAPRQQDVCRRRFSVNQCSPDVTAQTNTIYSRVGRRIVDRRTPYNVRIMHKYSCFNEMPTNIIMIYSLRLISYSPKYVSPLAPKPSTQTTDQLHACAVEWHRSCARCDGDRAGNSVNCFLVIGVQRAKELIISEIHWQCFHNKTTDNLYALLL